MDIKWLLMCVFPCRKTVKATLYSKNQPLERKGGRLFFSPIGKRP